MSCCGKKDPSLETLAAGLSTLPRQLRGFPEVRRDLLRALGSDPGPLAGWRPSGNDFGLMWLEMWAYIADVLGFYDERIANETYIGTAVRRTSLRRIVELLGYTPKSGVAGTATVAALADGAVAVTLPPATGFRSSGFGTEPPQIFEITEPYIIHPLKNQWKIESFKRRPTVDTAAAVNNTGATKTDKKSGSSSSGPKITSLLFEPAGFGLVAGEPVLFESREPDAPIPVSPQVTLVSSTEDFEGKDSLTYIRVSLQPSVAIDPTTDLFSIKARRSTQTVTPTSNDPVISENNSKTKPPAVANLSTGETRIFLDGAPSSFRRTDPIIVARNLGSASAEYRFCTIDSVKAAAVTVSSIPAQNIPVPQPDGSTKNAHIPSPSIAATELRLLPSLPSTWDDGAELALLYDFVDAGQPTNIGKTEIGAEDLTDTEGVPLSGIVTPPPEAVMAAVGGAAIAENTNLAGLLEQEFLLVDSVQVGAAVDGRIRFFADGRASFEVLSPEQLPDTKLKLPVTVYGNVLETTRGESVFGEVLGAGNGRVPNQRFKLKKKPLTYLPLASTTGDSTMTSTLQIRVDGVLWSQVQTFFGTGPEDRVYTARHDDEQNTFVTFGDGIRGARLPSGVKNVVASYRFGAGAAAPPAGSIKQLAGAVKGLRGVRSPIAASPGKAPDDPEQLRSNAPRTALLFGRAVSTTDFEALTREQPGIVQAKAEWLWIESQLQAGVVVQYIGTADAETISEALGAQADPTVPIEVTQAVAIPTTVSIGVEVDERYVKETVASSVLAALTAPGTGVLSLERARIGGTFWPSALYEAVAQVAGVVAVSGLSFTTTGGPVISISGGTCIETGKYLDFSAPNSVTVTGVYPTSTGTQS